MTKHLQRDLRTGRLSYRRVYPVELRPFIPKQPRELKRSLGAKSLQDREAALRYALINDEFERNVRAARLKSEGGTRPLTGSDVEFLARTHAHRLRKCLTDTHFDQTDAAREWLGASAWRFAPFGFMDDAGAEQAGREKVWTNAERIREALPSLLRHWQMLRADGDRAGIIEAEGQSAEDLLGEFALRTDLAGPLFFDFCHALLRADIAAAGQLMALATDGRDIEQIEAPQAPLPGGSELSVAVSPKAQETMSSLGEHLMEQRVDPVGPSTKQSWHTALRFWREVNGDLSCDGITRRKVNDWLELLSQRPVGIPRKLDALALPALLERFEGDAAVRRMSQKTLKQHVSSLSTIWNKAERRGYIEGMTNPFVGHDIQVKHTAGGNPLTINELNAIFRLPVFSRGERPVRGRGEASYWIPLLALFTGARPGEIAQLVVADFKQDADGHWWMQYTDEGEHPAIGKRRLKTSRHGTGQRHFPVPKTLIDLGLGDYLGWLVGEGESALFPLLTKTTKGLHEPWSRWWGLYLREHGAIADGKRQTREFRHSFITGLRAGGVSDEAISYLAGHSVQGRNTTRRYGDRDPYAAEIGRLRFDGLDLTNVRPWTAL